MRGVFKGKIWTETEITYEVKKFVVAVDTRRGGLDRGTFESVESGAALDSIGEKRNQKVVSEFWVKHVSWNFVMDQDPCWAGEFRKVGAN